MEALQGIKDQLGASFDVRFWLAHSNDRKIYLHFSSGPNLTC